MKFRELNPTNVVGNQKADGAAYLSINFKAGVWSFNGAAIEQLGIQEGCAVQLIQDEDNPEDWYIEFVEENGYILRDIGKSSKSLAFNSSGLRSQFLKSLPENPDAKSLKVRIATEATMVDNREFYALLTPSIKFR